MSRWLKIATSVIGLTACGLFVVLWVRSFYYHDTVWAPFPAIGRVMIRSEDGQVNPSGPWRTRGKMSWSIKCNTITVADTVGRDMRPPFWKTLKFGAYRERPLIGLVIPYWFPVLLSGLVAAAPWMKWRFSIRTMLIATAIASVVLCGVVLWLRSKLD